MNMHSYWYGCLAGEGKGMPGLLQSFNCQHLNHAPTCNSCALSSFVYMSCSSSCCEQAPCCILPLSAIYLPQGTC